MNDARVLIRLSLLFHAVIRCKDLRRAYEGPVHAYVKASLKNTNGEGVVKRTAVHRATPNPVFHETLILPCPVNNNHCSSKPTSLDIAVWHRDRRARRSELLGCMTLPLPLSQDKLFTRIRKSSCLKVRAKLVTNQIIGTLPSKDSLTF